MVLPKNSTLLLLLTMIFGASCSSVNKLALRSTADILERGSGQIDHEADWHLFKDALAGNIKLMETMSYADPENTTLLAMLAKSYAGLAFGVRETLYLDDYLGDKDIGFSKSQTIAAYSKSFEYGLSYLKLKGVSRKDLFAKDAASKLGEKLRTTLDFEDRLAVFYTAQSLGGMINLQKDNVELISRIGAVKAMMDWVCQGYMEFENGSCYLFYGMYEASRPATLGGDLEKAKTIFKKQMKENPQNLLIRVAYLQYYVIPMIDDVEYARQRETLLKEFKRWSGARNAALTGQGVELYRKASRFNLFNAIAHERFKIIEKNKNNIF